MGYFSGLFDVNSELDILVRKRGYLDKNVHLAIKAGQDRIYLIHLDPAGLEETMVEEGETAESFESILSRMRKEHEAELESQKNRFAAEIDRRDNYIQSLSNEKDGLLEENRELEINVEDKAEQIDELRKLMTQIQELSNQD